MSYRKIWEDAYGKIPYDTSGRRMEIHHIDGDRQNNSLDNLKLVTIQEHYDIHYSQGDWGACQSIVNRMKITPEEKSRMCSDLAKKRVENGTHHFMDPEFIKADSIRKSQTRKGKNHPLYGKPVTEETRQKRSVSHKKLVAEGNHHLQGDEHKKRMSALAEQQLKDGIHPFQRKENINKKKATHNKMLENKTHPFNNKNRIDPNKIMVTCDICNITVSKPMFGRYHKNCNK